MLHSPHHNVTKVAPPPRPFPWRCPTCGQKAVEPGVSAYRAKVTHDGKIHEFLIPELRLPICRSCGELIFTGAAADQINAALRSHLHLLTPDEIHAAIEQLGVSPGDVGMQLGIGEEQLLFWIDGIQIQSLAMDKLLRIYFGFPDVRSALVNAEQPLTPGDSGVLVR